MKFIKKASHVKRYGYCYSGWTEKSCNLVCNNQCSNVCHMNMGNKESNSENKN